MLQTNSTKDAFFLEIWNYIAERHVRKCWNFISNNLVLLGVTNLSKSGLRRLWTWQQPRNISDPRLNFSSERSSSDFVGSKVRENLKTGITRKHAKFFRKTNISYPLIAHGIRKNCCQKIWRALFSCNSRFEILTFVILPTILCTPFRSRCRQLICWLSCIFDIE